jgi:hypothetical protein
MGSAYSAARGDGPARPGSDEPGNDAASGDDGDIAMMARNGIVCVPANQYHVDGFRYSNLADALAQVKRGAAGRRASR